MSSVALKFEEINHSTASVILDGVCGPTTIKVFAKIPNKEMVSLRFYGDHNAVAQLKRVISALGSTENAIFSLYLSEYAPYTNGLTLENVEEIKAPDISPEAWKKMSPFDRQSLILLTVQRQSLSSLEDLSTRLSVARSHVSNVINKKRGLGWKAYKNLLDNFPLSVEMRNLVQDAMQKKR